MAWLPISGTLPQYSTSANELANDYYLKFYAAGTSTPINMATDSTGGTLLAKCALSADGYPISNPLDDSTAFIPHIDQNYRVVLYTNETDADNNATGSAAFNIDGMQLQAIVTGDAADVTLRAETLEEFDDYDRSPLFTDGDGFIAGAGPHVITVPAGWTPTNADMRFYKLDNSGIVTPLTPTAKTATTFTLAETLLSTDTVFLGDDVFRDLRADSFAGATTAQKQAAFGNIKQDATETSTGVVEEATAAEMTAGTDGKFPDCATIKGWRDPISIFTSAGPNTSVSAADILADTGFVVVPGRYFLKTSSIWYSVDVISVSETSRGGCDVFVTGAGNDLVITYARYLGGSSSFQVRQFTQGVVSSSDQTIFEIKYTNF